MCPSDTDELTTDVLREPIETASTPQVESIPKQGWNRRTFLRGAALGATARPGHRSACIRLGRRHA